MKYIAILYIGAILTVAVVVIHVIAQTTMCKGFKNTPIKDVPYKCLNYHD